MNSERSRQTKAELAEIQNNIDAATKTKLWAEGAPARARKAQADAAARRELRKRLILDPAASADFIAPLYDGRFNSPAEVAAAIQSAYTEFLAAHNLDDQAITFVQEFLTNHKSADISRVEVWNAALDYLEARMAAPHSVGVPVSRVEHQVEQVEPEVAPEVDDPLAGLTGRERENREREIYRQAVLTETLLNGVFADTLRELVEVTGLTMPGKVSLGFRQYLEAHKIPLTREEIRIAAATYFGSSVYAVLDDSERAEIDRRSTVASMNSDQVKQAVGYRNTYSPDAQGFASRSAL